MVVRDAGGAEGQCRHGPAVEQAARHVEGFLAGGAPFQGHPEDHDAHGGQGGQARAPEQPAPAQPAGHKAAHRRPAGDARVDGHIAEAQIAGPHLLGRGGRQQGQAGRAQHGGPHALEQAQADEKVDIRDEAQHKGQHTEQAQAEKEDPAPPVDVAQGAAGQLEHHQPQRVDGPQQAELARTGAQAFPQGRQDGVDPGHHERHEELRRADSQQQPAMFFCDTHGQP